MRKSRTQGRLLPRPAEWDGYNFEELQYQKALNAARVELAKNEINETATHFRNNIPSMGTKIIRNAFGALDYLDYIILGIKAFQKIRNIFKDKKSDKTAEK